MVWGLHRVGYSPYKGTDLVSIRSSPRLIKLRDQLGLKKPRVQPKNPEKHQIEFGVGLWQSVRPYAVGQTGLAQ